MQLKASSWFKTLQKIQKDHISPILDSVKSTIEFKSNPDTFLVLKCNKMQLIIFFILWFCLRSVCVSMYVWGGGGMVGFSAQCFHIHAVWASLASSQQQSHLCDILLWTTAAVTDGRLLMQSRRKERTGSISEAGAKCWKIWHDLPVRPKQLWWCQGQDEDAGRQVYQRHSG